MILEIKYVILNFNLRIKYYVLMKYLFSYFFVIKWYNNWNGNVFEPNHIDMEDWNQYDSWIIVFYYKFELI